MPMQIASRPDDPPGFVAKVSLFPRLLEPDHFPGGRLLAAEDPRQCGRVTVGEDLDLIESVPHGVEPG